MLLFVLLLFVMMTCSLAFQSSRSSKSLTTSTTQLLAKKKAEEEPLKKGGGGKSIKDFGYSRTVRPDPSKALDYFNETADTRITKTLALSLLVIPAILGWWVFVGSKPEAVVVDNTADAVYAESFKRLGNR